MTCPTLHCVISPIGGNRLRAAGANVDALEVFPTAGGFGTRATRRLGVGDTLVIIPRGVTMDEAAALASAFGPVVRDAYERMGMPLLSD